MNQDVKGYFVFGLMLGAMLGIIIAIMFFGVMLDMGREYYQEAMMALISNPNLNQRKLTNSASIDKTFYFTYKEEVIDSVTFLCFEEENCDDSYLDLDYFIDKEVQNLGALDTEKPVVNIPDDCNLVNNDYYECADGSKWADHYCLENMNELKREFLAKQQDQNALQVIKDADGKPDGAVLLDENGGERLRITHKYGFPVIKGENGGVLRINQEEKEFETYYSVDLNQFDSNRLRAAKKSCKDNFYWQEPYIEWSICIDKNLMAEMKKYLEDLNTE